MSSVPANRRNLLFVIVLITPSIVFSQLPLLIKQNIGVNQITKSIKAVNSSVAWLCGTSGVVNTSDGGSSWQLRLPGSFDVIEAVDENIAFSVDNSHAAVIYRTSDFGITWTPVHTESTYINGVKMFDDLNGIAIGDPIDSVWRVLRTTDGGLTWNFVPSSPKMPKCEAGHTNSVAIAGKKYVWFGTIGCGGHKIYKSTDAGITWTSSPAQFDDAYGIWFNDSLHGVVAMAGGFFYTTDGGENWSWDNKLRQTAYNVCGIGSGEFWGICDSAIYSSTDAGLTWTEVYRDTTRGLGHASFVNVNGTRYGWIACGKGTVIKYTSTPTGAHQEPFSPLKDFVLQQSYPNPFNPTTTIQFGIPIRSRVRILIYNTLGQEVAELTNGEWEAGYHKVQWNAMGASGIYFCRMEATGVRDPNSRFVQVRKMLLMK